MIAHLSGALLDKQVQRLVIDVGGVGYEVFVPLSTFYSLGDPGSRVALRIHTHVRDSAIQLFGFATPLEMALFERLIAVSGIGPKVALAVLSGIDPLDLVHAVRKADLARLTRIPGVGRKTAERLVVELNSGVAIAIPVRFIQGLADATPAARRDVTIAGGGVGLHWPRIDLDLGVRNLLAGAFGTREWMSELAQHAGSRKSAANAKAARENGRKGGRPRKRAAEPAVRAS